MTDPPRDLRSQFVDAAQDLIDRRRHHRRRRILAGAAAALVVAGLAVTIVDRPRTASAAIFEVHHEDDAVVIDILGRVDDPDVALQELDRNGVEADLEAVPTPSFLIGDVVSVQVESAQIERSEGGQRVTSIRLPTPTRHVTINYGREAGADETYEASGSPPNCDDYRGHVLDASMQSRLADEYGPDLRWQMQRDGSPVNVEKGDLAPASRLVDIIPVNASEAIIVVTDGSSQPISGTECGIG